MAKLRHPRGKRDASKTQEGWKDADEGKVELNGDDTENKNSECGGGGERGARAPASPRESSGGRRVMRFMCHGGSKLKFHTTLSKAYLWEQFSYSCNISHPARSQTQASQKTHKRTHKFFSTRGARTIRPTSGINYQAGDENSKDGNLEGKNTNVGTRVGGGGGSDLTRGHETHS